jgi:hypothetical protein
MKYVKVFFGFLQMLVSLFKNSGLTPAPVGQRLCRFETGAVFQKWRDNVKSLASPAAAAAIPLGGNSSGVRSCELE